MSIIFIAIGDEVLRGETREGNAHALASRLSGLGVPLDEVRIIADRPRAVMAALTEAAHPGRLVITSGGLGPTDDDGTRLAVADAAGVGLIEHAGLADDIKQRYERLGRRWVAANLKQARIPLGASPLANRHGTAPGFAVSIDGGLVACMPGPPREFGAMVADHLAALLAMAGIEATPVVEHCLRIFGITESALQEKLASLPGHHEVRIRSLPRFPEIRLDVRAAPGVPDEQAAAFAQQAAAALSWRVFSSEREVSFAEVVARELVSRGLHISVAESCTGGLVGHLLTEVPGASATLQADFVTYANTAKAGLLGVPEDVFDEHGAVSEPCARAMAEGARARTGADYAVATTGIAGPGGGSIHKPVGTIWFAVAGPGGTVSNTRLFAGLDRSRFKLLSAWTALALLRRAVLSAES